MGPTEFAEALELIVWSRVQAAERLHQLPITVRKWASGHARVPDTVTAWLRPYAAEAAALHARHPPPRSIRPARP
jgi:hypothetical protein